MGGGRGYSRVGEAFDVVGEGELGGTVYGVLMCAFAPAFGDLLTSGEDVFWFLDGKRGEHVDG